MNSYAQFMYDIKTDELESFIENLDIDAIEDRDKSFLFYFRDEDDFIFTSDPVEAVIGTSCLTLLINSIVLVGSDVLKKQEQKMFAQS